MRSKGLSWTLAVALAAPALVHAHGTGNKVVGTVTAVHAAMNHFEVKTADGHTVGIKVADKTKFTRGTAAAAFADLKEGTRVVVTTTGQGDARTATLVKLGTATKAAADTAPPAHKH
jgi:hypothetical protein